MGGFFFRIIEIWNKLKDVKPFSLGRSTVVTLPRKNYKSWLNAVGFKAEWLDKNDLLDLLKTDIVNDRKIFVLIPLFESDYEKGDKK